VNVELRIEELVLHGFPPGNHDRIGESVERELTRLFTERGVPPSLARDGEVGSLGTGAFEMDPGLGAEAIGAQVAHSLYEGLVSRATAPQGEGEVPARRSKEPGYSTRVLTETREGRRP
jgi:hypothetical protein